jgi:methyltransferase (TIGR00027 family)
MQEAKPSATALNVAIGRALHLFYDDDPKIFDDPIGARLAEEADRALFAARREARLDPMQILSRSNLVLRSRFAEDQLALAAARGIVQYAILGAGLDTFAYRQPEFAGRLRIFDVDRLATQAWKRPRFAAIGLREPSNLHWAAIDFERQTLLQALAAEGFDRAQPSYFSWLGVTPYLTRQAIDAILCAVASLPPPSSITLSFVLPPKYLNGLDLETSEALTRRLAGSGEPQLTQFEVDELRGHLYDLGFSDVFHLTPEEAGRRYFQGRRDGLRAPEWAQLMTATV